MTSAATPTRLPALLAGGWVALVAGLFLVRYEGWLIPLQFAHLFAVALPGLTVGPYFAEFLRGRVLDFLWLGLLLATALPVGKVIVRRDGVLENLFALALGLLIVSAATLGIAAVSTSQVGWVFTGILAWALPAARRFTLPAWGKLTGWEWLMVILLVVAAVLCLPGAMVPPFEYDELEYHLGAPMDYIRAGRVYFLPYNFYSNLPQLSEMLYLLALVTRSDVAAKLLHWLFGVMTAASIIALGARLWSRRVGLTAAVLFYCLPYVQDLSQTARIDLATTFFATLAFGGLLLKWDTLSALAAGCAVATKWTAIPVVALPLVGAILVRDRKLWPAIRYGLLIAMPVVPWLVKNTLLAGDPVYPLWLKSPHWSAEQAALFAQKHYPVFGWNQLFERAWQYSFAEPGAVPLILLALPLVVFCWRQSDRVRWTAYLFVGAYAGWFLLTFRPWRFLMPAIPLAALVGGFALEQQSKWFKSALVLLVTVALALMGTTVLVDARDPATTPPQLSFLQHALGESSRTEFIRQLGRGVYEPVVWMNEHLPASAKVLYVGEARVYYARHHALWSTAFDQHPLALPDLDKLGVTHVYINFSELQRLSAGYGYLADVDWGAFRRYLQTRAREIYRSDRAVVYEL